MVKLIRLGRAFFAIAIAAFGIQFLIHGLFSLGPGSGPPWTPAHPFWAYFTAIVCVAAAICIAANVQVRCAAIVLAVTILMRALLFYAPKLAAHPHDPSHGTAGSSCSLCAAALVLAGAHSTPGRLLFAIPLVVLGVQHFLYPQFIATLVPLWIPGHLFWAYLVGVALVAAALSIATQIKAGLAATWLGVMLLLFELILHIPRVAANLHGGNEWTSLFVALAMSGGAFMVAGSSSRKTSA